MNVGDSSWVDGCEELQRQSCFGMSVQLCPEANHGHWWWNCAKFFGGIKSLNTPNNLMKSYQSPFLT